MSFHDFMRFFAGACAVFVAIFLVRGIVARRSYFAGRVITPAEDAKIYWLLVAKNAWYLVGLVLLATIVPDRLFSPVLFLSLFVPTLAFALLTGHFEWEADDRRIDSPRRFWRWVAFYAVLIALFVVVLVWEWLSPTTA
jgi:hypothetical protein